MFSENNSARSDRTSPAGADGLNAFVDGEVEELDLSWNHLSSELFACLGENVAKRAVAACPERALACTCLNPAINLG